MLQDLAQNGKANLAQEPLFAASALKKGRCSFEAIGGKEHPIPSEGRRIFPDMRLVILLERKRFKEMKDRECPQEGRDENSWQTHTSLYFLAVGQLIC